MLRHIKSDDVVRRIQDIESAHARVYIIIRDVFSGEMMMADNSPTAPYERQAKNILKGELKRRGITYAALAEKLSERGTHESERNLANKISRGSFTAAFFMMCMDVIGVRQVSLEA